MDGKNRLQLWQRMSSGFFLILTLLFFAGCGSAAEKDFTPLASGSGAVAAELPGGVKMARDAAFTYVTFNYDIPLPLRDADWIVEYDFLEDCTGAGAYRLTAESCVVTISNPLMIPNSVIYHVILDDAAAGFHWEGDVDYEGEVLRPWSSMDDSTAFDPGTINVVEIAGLRKTTGIEVCRLDCASYTPLYTIGKPELITALVDALDSDLPLRPHTRCPAAFQLRFLLEDGHHVDFGYTCQMMTPTFLRGNQDFWMGQDAVAPDAFNELMLPLITPEAIRGYEWPLPSLLG